MKNLHLSARMPLRQSDIWERFILQLYINDLRELQKQGWELPADLNFAYMQCLASGSSTTCTP